MQIQVFTAVGPTLNNLVKTAGLAGVAAKGAVHGVIGGALSIARGGNFQQGFISSAIAGGISGITTGEGALLGDIPGGEGIALRTAISATAGCAAASAIGGKCSNGAVTAAFGHLYNSERLDCRFLPEVCFSQGGDGVIGGGGVRIPSNTKALPSQQVPNAGGKIISYITKQDEVFFRVFSGNSNTGRFLTKTPPTNQREAIEGLALPPGNNANFIQRVIVPTGTRLQRSRALPAFGRRGGKVKFELLDRIPNNSFGRGVPLK